MNSPKLRSGIGRSTVYKNFALALFLAVSIAGCKGIAVDETLPGGGNCTGGINCNPGPNGVNTGANLIIDFPIDAAQTNWNGPMLQGQDDYKSTFRVRFFPGHEVLPGGGEGPATTLETLTIIADSDYAGLTIAPFITEEDMVNNQTTFEVTVPVGPHVKTKIIRISALATDSGGAILSPKTMMVVNTHTILTTNPEYDVTTNIDLPDLNPITEDTLNIHLKSTLNQDLLLTGVAQLIDNPPGRFAPEYMPYYFPIVGKMVLGGGNNPEIQAFPLSIDFPPGTVQDLPGQKASMKNFCIRSIVSTDLTNFAGPIECVTGEPVQVELSGLPGLLFTLQGNAIGAATTTILPTDPARGLSLNMTQVTTAIDLDETTIDTIGLSITEATTQADLSIAGKLELIFPPGVDPTEPPVIVDFSTQPIDLANLQSVSNPVSLHVPEGVLQDLGFTLQTKNIQLLMNLSPDFRFSYGAILPGGAAATPLANFAIEGTSFGFMTPPPEEPGDPHLDVVFTPLLILGVEGNATTMVATFTPGTTSGSPSTVQSATITPLGNDANKVVFGKTSLTGADFVGGVASIPVTVAPGVSLTVTTIVGVQIAGVDSAGVPFTGYAGLTLKRTGPQPPIPNPPPFLYTENTTKPDVVLSTADKLVFTTDLTAIYGNPGQIIMAGTATLIDPPGFNFQIPISSTFVAKTRDIFTAPINVTIPPGILLDLTGVVGIQTLNLSFSGRMTPDLQAAVLTVDPGGQVLLPNGITQDKEGPAIMQLTFNVQQEPDDPDLSVVFSPNPVIYGITPGNQTILNITFTPGTAGGSPTTLADITCKADKEFDALHVSDFVDPSHFTNNVAQIAVIPPPGYNPQAGELITVYCEAIDSAGQRTSAADASIYSNSPFQAPLALPDFIMESFSVDPEINPNTPPPGFFPFIGDGLRLTITNQFMIPGLLQPTVTGTTTLTHFTKTDSLNPPQAHWQPFTDVFYGGQDFILDFNGTVDLHDLTLRVPPFGVSNNPGLDPTCITHTFGLIPGGPVCFPAGQALEDVMLNGAPQTLIVPIINYAINGAFSTDLRTISVKSALGCSANMACDGVNLCPYPNPKFGEPCAPTDVNPNPFGLTTKVYGMPGFVIFVPQNSFGVAIQQ